MSARALSLSRLVPALSLSRLERLLIFLPGRTRRNWPRFIQSHKMDQYSKGLLLALQHIPDLPASAAMVGG